MMMVWRWLSGRKSSVMPLRRCVRPCKENRSWSPSRHHQVARSPLDQKDGEIASCTSLAHIRKWQRAARSRRGTRRRRNHDLWGGATAPGFDLAAAAPVSRTDPVSPFRDRGFQLSRLMTGASAVCSGIAGPGRRRRAGIRSRDDLRPGGDRAVPHPGGRGKRRSQQAATTRKRWTA